MDDKQLLVKDADHSLSGSMEAFVTFFVAFVSTCLVLSFAGNLLIFICIWRQMKSTGTISATDVFVLNLALSDMVFGGFVLPQQLHDVSHSGDFYEGMRITLGWGMGYLGGYGFKPTNEYLTVKNLKL